MSVFTPLDDERISALLSQARRQLISAQPAAHGTENSNYLLRARDTHGADADCVLTLFEQLPGHLLPWFCQLLDALAAAGLPVPAPLDVAGERILMVAEKPALLVPWLPGSHPDQPNEGQCRAIGEALATLHGVHFPVPHPLHDDATGMDELEQEISALPRLQSRVAALWRLWKGRALPQTLIHGDLFRDNALFEGDRLTGLLDFYAAGHGPAVYDVAVCLNDWCMPAGARAPALEYALLTGYNSIRPLAIDEREHLHAARCVAALRFWLSRRVARRRHEAEGESSLVLSKDPAQCEQRLEVLLADHA